jgi:hypothetical protein
MVKGVVWPPTKGQKKKRFGFFFSFSLSNLPRMQRWVFHFLDLRKMWAHRLFEGIWFLVFGFWFWGSGDRRKKEKKRREEEDFFF